MKCKNFVPFEDTNQDGVITYNDVTEWVMWVFYAPGDGILHWVMTNWPGFATFFEITPANYCGFLSLALSAFAWGALIGITTMFLGVLTDALKRSLIFFANLDGYAGKYKVELISVVVLIMVALVAALIANKLGSG